MEHRGTPFPFRYKGALASSPPGKVKRACIVVACAAAATLSLLFGLGAPAAHAGSYVLRTKDASGNPIKNPSGGTVTNPSVSMPYGSVTGGYGGSTGYGNAGVSCSGSITTIFDWVPSRVPNPDPAALTNSDPNDDTIPDPSDTPPTEVIATEWCKATYSAITYGTGGGSPSGACDNGLGFTPTNTSGPVTTSIPVPPYFMVIGTGVSGISEGTRYKKQAGGQTVTLTCGPSASASTSNGPCNCSVAYTASVAALDVTFVGTTRDGSSRKFLTGQQLTASLVSGGLGVQSGTYQWTVAGNPFKSYRFDSVGAVIPLAAGDRDDPTVSFYTARHETVTATCSATLVIPTGAHAEGGLPSVTVTSRPVESIRPTVSNWPVENGEVRVHPTDNYRFGYYGLVGSSYLNGQDWHNVTVTADAPFQNQGSSCFVQLINASRSLTRNLPIGSTAAATYVKKPYNGTQTLDMNFPYPYGSQWNISAQGTGYDSPSQPITVSDVDGGGTFWYLSTASDTLNTWVMYRPPSVGGQGTTWVPLSTYQWGWNGTAENTPPWSLTAKGATPGSPADTYDFPTWTLTSPSPFSFGPP